MAIDKREQIVIALLALCALVIRLVVVFGLSANPLVYDSAMYLLVANGMVNEAPISSFPNGYPLIIALFKAFLSTKQTITALLASNVLLSTLCVPLTYIVIRSATKAPKIAFLSAVLMMIYPHQLRYAQLVMTETISTFVLLSAICLLYITQTRLKESKINEALVYALICGLVFHMAGAIRPSLVGIGVLTIGWLAFTGRSWKVSLSQISGFIVGFLLLFIIEHSPIARPPQTLNNNLLIAISSTSNNIEFVSFSPDQQRRAVSTYFKFALSKPVEFTKQRAIAFWELWGPKSLSGYKQEQETGLVKSVIIIRSILLLLSIVCLIRNRQEAGSWMLGIPLIVITVVHTLTFGNHRFLVPIEPYLFGLAFWGAATLKRKQRDKGNVPVPLV